LGQVWQHFSPSAPDLLLPLPFVWFLLLLSISHRF
jgi:hypothetical protein